ncbi:MAG: hypothetical protein LBF13_07165 [Campylobacteraceae bacterium]|nr:hypothetical protein [Campylobacteraceae bacterium]
MQYELINRLPEIYKNLQIGDLTLFHNGNSEQLSEVDKIGYLFGSLMSGFGNKKKSGNVSKDDNERVDENYSCETNIADEIK